MMTIFQDTMKKHLTLATWNTNGPVQNRGKHVHLRAIPFDVAAIQECEPLPLADSYHTLYHQLPHGTGTRCISIVSPHKLKQIAGAPECSIAAFVDGPHGSFVFVSVWVKPIASGAGAFKYIMRLPPIFEWAKDVAGDLPVVVAGDFNCNGGFGLGRGKKFRELADTWRSSAGLESAWHQRTGFPMGIKEDPTWIPHRKGIPEYMIDYIFVPVAWRVDSVRLQEAYGSDHRPLIADVMVPG